MAMTSEDGTLTAGVGKDVGKEDPAKKKNAILELLGFAGKRRVLAYVGCGLSLLNAVLTVMPLVCVWFVVRDLVSVYPNWAEASSAAMWAVLAVVFAVLGIIVYFGALMASHLAAFRIAANMRKAMVRHVAQIPIGYFSAHSSGEMRRVIDGCAGQTEDLIAHKLPDFVGSFATPVIFFVVSFLFDWRMGLLCLVPIAVSFAAMWWMMGREDEKGGRHFMELYQAALMRMSAAATEYVRGIPVVKVFQQTVLSFKAFHEAIIDYRDMATNYTEYCRRPQVVQLVAINSTFAVLVPAGIPGVSDRLPVLCVFLGDDDDDDVEGHVFVGGSHDRRRRAAADEHDHGSCSHRRGGVCQGSPSEGGEHRAFGCQLLVPRVQGTGASLRIAICSRWSDGGSCRAVGRRQVDARVARPALLGRR